MSKSQKATRELACKMGFESIYKMSTSEEGETEVSVESSPGAQDGSGEWVRPEAVCTAK